MSETVKSPPSRAWEWLGLRLVETGEGTAVVEMTTTEDMANHSGFVHGGMISTLADSAMGRSVRTLKPGVVRAMSFDLKLNFINAAKVGENMRATGHVIHAGRRTVVAECRVEGGGRGRPARGHGERDVCGYQGQGMMRGSCLPTR